jgi:uroporphyrinogen decarboxylase
VLDPDWIRDFNRVHTDHLKAHYRILLEEAGVPDGMWLYEDLGYKERLFCSPSAPSARPAMNAATTTVAA